MSINLPSPPQVPGEPLARRLLDTLRVIKARMDADSGWIDVSNYGANWSSYDTTTYRAQYRKLPSGMVIFQGMVKKSVALALPETMFTLPAGFRPGKAGPVSLAGATGYAGCQMYSTGQLNVEVGGSPTWISLTSLRYLAEL